MTALPPINTEAELLALIAERGSVTSADLEDSEYLGIYAELINNLVDKDALNCTWTGEIPAEDGFYFLSVQTWTLKGDEHDTPKQTL